MHSITLADALADLRRELYKANEESKREDLKLEIDAIDVEFEVEIVKSGEAGGKLRFNVILAEGEVKGAGDLRHAHTHRVKLHLKPQINGRNLQVHGRGAAEDN